MYLDKRDEQKKNYGKNEPFNKRGGYGSLKSSLIVKKAKSNELFRS
jgi:hypothetical protein